MKKKILCFDLDNVLCYTSKKKIYKNSKPNLKAIETANELFKNLENNITQFNDTRIKRTKMIDRKSKFNYFIFHISNPLICFIRNILMKHLVRNNKFINSYLGTIYKN